jgi:hypothetical protein
MLPSPMSYSVTEGAPCQIALVGPVACRKGLWLSRLPYRACRLIRDGQCGQRPARHGAQPRLSIGEEVSAFGRRPKEYREIAVLVAESERSFATQGIAGDS